MKKIFYFFLFLSFISCKNVTEDKKNVTQVEDKPQEVQAGASQDPFTSAIEETHKKTAFLEKEAIQFDIDINFGGKDRLDATITMLTNSTKIRIDKKDGSSLVYDGNEVYLAPSSANSQGARFDMFTWTYFFALPYKLNDKGTVWTENKELQLGDSSYQTAKLSFEKNIGDAPDDWYVIYADKNTNRLYAAGYIVTFGNNDVQKAEADPHAIEYKDYIEVENIPFATQWIYYGWTVSEGFTDQIGDASLTNIKFVNPEKTFFEKPENASVISL